MASVLASILALVISETAGNLAADAYQHSVVPSGGSEYVSVRPFEVETVS